LTDETRRARMENDDWLDELPLLVDPTVSTDPPLMWFGEDGAATPGGNDSNRLNWQRADVSIKRYHLNHPEVVEARIALFDQLNRWLGEADTALNRAAKGNPDAQRQASSRVRDLKAAVRETAEYSAAARCFLEAKGISSLAAKMALR
jgi:hypothetical protein